MHFRVFESCLFGNQVNPTLIQIWFVLWRHHPMSNAATTEALSLWEAEIQADAQALSVQLFRFFIPGAAVQPPCQLSHAVCGGHVLARGGAELPQPKLQKVQDGVGISGGVLHSALLGAAQCTKATGANRHVQLPGTPGGAGFSHLPARQGQILYLVLNMSCIP